MISLIGLVVCESLAMATPARFAVIVGNNHSLEADSPELSYADDDAAMFELLLAPYMTRLDLLTVLDVESQRLHPGLAARTRAPTAAELRRALADTFAAIRAATGPTELYFVFVGHGSVDDQGEGYVHLQDARFGRDQLFAEVIAASPAEVTHVILDACNAFSVVGGRGAAPPSAGLDSLFDTFLAGHQLEAYPNVGVLAATSDERETHEWSRLRAGVFSHQVRSALSGAADINEDGRVEYSEVAAFIDAANADLARLGKRVAVFAWPPGRDRRRPLLDRRDVAGARRVTILPEVGGRLFLETEAGARLADMHRAGRVTLTLPVALGFFVRDGEHELWVAPGDADVTVQQRPDEAYQVAARGAVDRAFEQGLFAVPFSRDYYRGRVGARPRFLGVELEADGAYAAAEVPPWGLRAAWVVGASPVAEKKLEVGAELAASIALGELLGVDVAAQAAYAVVRPQVGVGRVAVYAGPSLGAAWWDRLRLKAGLDLAWAVTFIDGAPSSVDPSCPGLRVRGSAGVRVVGDLWLEAGAAYSVYLVSMGEQEELRPSPQGYLGVGWR